MKIIHDTDQSLMIEDQPWLIGILMIVMALVFAFGGMALLASGEGFGGAMMLLVGVGVPVLIGALMVQRVRLTFDRSTGTVTRTRRSVLGLTIATHALDRLDQARVGVSTDGDGTTYRMELDLRDPPEVVPFTSYYTSGRRPEAMARAVNDWLTRPR
ncbi:hypothetical protein [Tabrizicola aquatica]|uniref:hypothetical protein n=1 Tax=Tabrizicola aquatica TaxID=909926 RepID=UPI000CD0F5E6|nr:hypothetical protein [Tabrizicola aquatica]